MPMGPQGELFLPLKITEQVCPPDQDLPAFTLYQNQSDKVEQGLRGHQTISTFASISQVARLLSLGPHGPIGMAALRPGLDRPSSFD